MVVSCALLSARRGVFDAQFLSLLADFILFGGAFQLCHLALMVKLHGVLDRQNGVHEISVELKSLAGNDGGAFRADETMLLHQTNIFANGVRAETAVLADSCVARVALKCFSILDGHEVGVDDDLGRVQSQIEDLVWEGKEIFAQSHFFAPLVLFEIH